MHPLVASLCWLSSCGCVLTPNTPISHEIYSGANIVLINSGFNLLGRLVYGALSDRIGQKPIFVVSLFSQVIDSCG